MSLNSAAAFLNEDHFALAEAVRQFARGQAELGEDDEAAVEWVRAMGRAGLLAYVVPQQFGGRGERPDVRSLCVIREHLAYVSGLADSMFALQGLGSYPITLAGSGTVQEAWLPRVASGEAIAAFALTEPEAGSDAAAITTRARREGDEYVIDGVKRFISNAGIAAFYTVFAQTNADEGHRGLSAIVVTKDAAGLSLSQKLEMMAAHPLGEIKFAGSRVPAANRLGVEGEGFKLAMRTLDTFRPTVGAAAVGLAQRALDEALSYAQQRIQFGRPLAEFQLTQAKLAEMATELEAARLLVYRAAWVKDRGAERVTLEAAMAKLYATEAAQRIIDAAVQIHGGNGVLRGTVVERLYREIRALRIYEGTSEIQKLVIAAQLLKGDKKA